MSTTSDQDDDQDDLYYFDASDFAIPDKPGTVMHLTINYQTIRNHVKSKQHHVKFVNSEHIDVMLDDIDYYKLTGHTIKFDTFVHAVSTVQQLHNFTIHDANAVSAVEKTQKLEELQPHFAWKPLEVIKRTLAKTTQYARTIAQYPLQKHHISRFPWDNCQKIHEDVAMDTYFLQIMGADGSTCAQLYVGLASRMINVYLMPSKASCHILKSYQDFMRYEGIPECLH